MKLFETALPERIGAFVRRETAHLQPSVLEDQANSQGGHPGAGKDFDNVRTLISSKLDISAADKLFKEKSNKSDTEMAIR